MKSLIKSDLDKKQLAQDGMSHDHLSPDVPIVQKVKSKDEFYEKGIGWIRGHRSHENIKKTYGVGLTRSHDFISSTTAMYEDMDYIQANNIQLTENALNNSQNVALTISKTGIITWLPKAGSRWLQEFQQPPASEHFSVGALLPTPILIWFRSQQSMFINAHGSNFKRIRGGMYFSIKLYPCSHSEEYILLMEKKPSLWHAMNVKASVSLNFHEAELLMWISRGKSNKDIALMIDSNTRKIDEQLGNIFEKLGVTGTEDHKSHLKQWKVEHLAAFHAS